MTQLKRHYKENDREIQQNIIQAEIREKETQLEQRLKEIEKEIIRCRDENEKFFSSPYYLALAELKISLRDLKHKLRRGH